MAVSVQGGMPRRLSLLLASVIAAVLDDTHSRRHHHHHQSDDDDDFDDVDLRRSLGLVSAVEQGVWSASLSARVDPTLPGITCRHVFC